MKATSALLVVASSFLMSTAFAQSVPTGMLSPTRPVLVDSNGNGYPDPGDMTALPSATDPLLTGDTSTIANPWDCGGSYNTLALGSKGGDGRYRQVTRVNGSGQTQTATIDQASGGRAIHMSMTESGSGLSGGGGLVDANQDGIFDGIVGSTTNYAINIPLVFSDTNGDTYGDYVSIPWAQASLLGVNTGDTCGVGGSTDPQLWVPMADTDGDGRPDSVVLDLDGNGQPDPDHLWSAAIGPALAGSAIPSMSTLGMICLALGLALAGAWVVRGGTSLGV